MANLMDYVDWRKDLDFKADPFNIVDNLLFSECTYIDFEEVMEDGNTITEVAQAYFQKHSEKEIQKRKTFYHLAPFLLPKMAHSKRFGKIVLSDYVNIVDKNMQISAITFACDDFIYIAYRGTDDTLVGWKEDFDFSYKQETPGQREALRYCQRIAQKYPQKIYIGGHSKGGNFAYYVAMHASKAIQERLVQVYSNDGPGFIRRVWQEVDPSILNKMVKISPCNCTIGALLENPVQPIYCLSNQMGLMQHDCLSWQILGKQFVTGQQDAKSLWFENTIRQWVVDVDFVHRQQFVETIFGIFQQAGVYCLEDFSGHQIQILKAINDLPKEESQLVQSLLRKLLGSSKKVLVDQVKRITN